MCIVMIIQDYAICVIFIASFIEIENSVISCKIVSIFYFHKLVSLSSNCLYPEYKQLPRPTHRQCVGLSFRRSHDRGSLSAASLVICSPARIAVCNTRSSGGTALCRMGGATSQLDLPSPTPLSVALWLNAIRSSPLGYFSKLLQVVDNLTHILL